MAKEIAFVNGRISKLKGLVTLTLTLDRVILHTVMLVKQVDFKPEVNKRGSYG